MNVLLITLAALVPLAASQGGGMYNGMFNNQGSGYNGMFNSQRSGYMGGGTGYRDNSRNGVYWGGRSTGRGFNIGRTQDGVEGYEGPVGGRRGFPLLGGAGAGEMYADGGARMGMGNGYGSGHIGQFYQRQRTGQVLTTADYDREMGMGGMGIMGGMGGPGMGMGFGSPMMGMGGPGMGMGPGMAMGGGMGMGGPGMGMGPGMAMGGGMGMGGPGMGFSSGYGGHMSGSAMGGMGAMGRMPYTF